MEDPVMLRLVEPDEPEQVVVADPGKKVGDLGGACHGPGRGLGDKDRRAGEPADFGDGRPEHRLERVSPPVVVAIDPDDVHVTVPWPPALQRCGGGVGAVDRPEPPHIASASLAEDTDDVPPCRHEYVRPRVPGSPGIP